MRKWMSILLGLCLCLGCFGALGCGNDDYPYEEGATVLKFWAMDFSDWENEYLEERVREFNSILDDGIQVEMIFYQDAAYIDALASSRQTGTEPDIFMRAYTNLVGDVQAGHAAALNDYLPESTIADISDNIREMVEFDGKLYGMPSNMEPSTMLYYNKEMLAAAGVNSDPADWDWKDLVDACAKIKPTLRTQQYALGVPLGGEAAWAYWGWQYNTTGSRLLNDNWDACLIDTTESPTKDYAGENDYANMVRLIWDLAAEGYTPIGSVSASGYSDMIDALCMEKLAMAINGSWSIGVIMNEYPTYASKIGLAPIPTIDGDKTRPSATNGGWTYAVSSAVSADRQRMAAAFINWLWGDTDRVTEYCERGHYCKISGLKSVQAKVLETASPTYREWIEVTNDVASRAINEPLYNFEVSLELGSVWEWATINADPAVSEAQLDALILAQLREAKSGVEAIIERDALAGKNPHRPGA